MVINKYTREAGRLFPSEWNTHQLRLQNKRNTLETFQSHQKSFITKKFLEAQLTDQMKWISLT